MKSIILSVALAFAACGAYAQSGNAASGAQAAGTRQSLAIGAEIPMANAKMKMTDGKVSTLGRAKTDQGLLVMFSCNTCPYVVKSQGRTNEMMKMAAATGIGMVIVNSNEAQRSKEDSYQAMGTYAKEQGYTVGYALDEGSRVANAFGATRTPEVFLFDANGKLVYKGAMEDNPSDPASSQKMYLATAIKTMVKGGKIDPAETKSIGCSIKRVQ